MELGDIEQVLERHREALMAVPGVLGTAIGACEGRPCIRVFVRNVAREHADLPLTLDGWTVRVEQSARFDALS